MRRKIIVVAHVEDDRDRSGTGINSLIGIKEGLTGEVASSLSGSRYNLKPIIVQTYITDEIDMTANGKQGSLSI